MNVGTLTIMMSANSAGLRNAGRSVRLFEMGVSTSARTMNASIASVGRSFSQLSIPIGIVAGAATKMFSDFEFSLAKVEGLVGIAHDQTMEWGKALLKMAPATAQGPNKLAESLYYVTSAGIRGARTLDVVRRSALAASAGMGEAKDVADVVTSAMNAYGKGNLSAAQAMDILVMTVREGKKEAAEMTSALGMVFPVAAKLKISFDQVGAAVAAMTRTGTPGSTAGTQLRRVLTTLLQEAPRAEEALNKMGSSFKQIRRLVKDKGLLEGLLEIKRMTDIRGEEYMADIFPNIRALVPVLDLLGENLEDNKIIFTNLHNAAGAFDRLIGVVSKTFKFQFNQALADAGVTMTQLGKAFSEYFIPIIWGAVRVLKRFTDWFTNLSGAQKKLIIQVSLLVAAIGPLIVIIGTLISVALTPLKLALWAVITPIKLLLTLLSAIFSPIGIVVAAVIALGTAFVYVKKEGWAWVLAFSRIWAQIRLLFLEGKKHVLATMQSLLPDFLKLINSFLPQFLQIPIPKVDSKKMMKDLLLDADIALLKKQIAATEDFNITKAFEITDKSFMTDIASAIDWIQGKFNGLTAPDWLLGIGGMPSEGGIGKDMPFNSRKMGGGFAAKAPFPTDLFQLLNSKEGERTPSTLKGNTFEQYLKGLRSTLKSTYEIKETADKLNIDEVFATLDRQLIKTAQDATIFGSAIDTNAVQLDKYNQAFSKLQTFDVFTPEQLEMIKQTANAYSLLVEKIAASKSTMDSGLELMDSGLELMQAWKTAGNALISIFQQLGGIIGGAFEKAINKITPYVSLVTKVLTLLKAIGVIEEINTAKKAANTAVTAAGIPVTLAATAAQGTLAVANTEVAITGAAASTSWIPVVGVGLAVAGIAAVLIALNSGKSKAAGLAKGGIIGPGYPNDSFPAMLSSNEAVIPLDKLPQMVGVGAGNINVTVNGEISGENIHWIVQEIERKRNNSF